MDRVLIIDDERRIRMILRRLLQDEGYEVDVADSGERGIEVAREALDSGAALRKLEMLKEASQS